MVSVCRKHNVERDNSGNCSQCCKEYRSRNKDKAKKYRDAHKEKMKLYQKKWADAHKDEIGTYKKKWADKHKDKTRLYAKKYYDGHKEQADLRTKLYLSEHKDKAKLYQQKCQKKRRNTPNGQLRFKARNTAYNAVRSGKIIKTPCQVCGNSKVEAHHLFGYEKENWLSVVFLCRKHHVQADHDSAFNETLKSTGLFV